MIECFVQGKNTTPLKIFTAEAFQVWEEKQPVATREWLKSSGFTGKHKDVGIIPSSDGGIEAAVYIYEPSDLLEFGALPRNLPSGSYQLDEEIPEAGNLALGWALEAYRFDRFKGRKACEARIVWPQDSEEGRIAASIYWVRDLINRPANDLPPRELAAEAKVMAEGFGATMEIYKGEELLEKNFPAIYAVGQAGPTPHLIDISWGDPAHPKVTLVGKGVCFDTGGLDLKDAANMRLMKKDMGGAAIALGVGKLIMEEKLPIQLRIIIAAVENSVSSSSLRPGDIITTRKGLTVEVGNTDAEGRVVLSDSLTLAVEGKPDLIMDFATLTGAARVALGPDLPVIFSNAQNIAEGLSQSGAHVNDHVWQLPLWKGYNRYVKGKIADLCNDPGVSFAGAINAALFLEHFVEGIPWVHIDTIAYNPSAMPGRPEGGEATSLRCVYAYLKERFGS